MPPRPNNNNKITKTEGEKTNLKLLDHDKTHNEITQI